ncbi:hypothetical protein IFM89_001477 [Coptis chinensis]|uniref:Uncharacterized protein n=1 Tax=Coptis chinensis TaxID=261450 RepID=A0A835LCF2_9MAGN|nr:hypothetical protein IFM89_001477 [Coptis chinensis]
MTDLSEANWTDSYLGKLLKEDTYKLHILQEGDELAVQIAKKIANVEYGLRSGSLVRNLDANKNKKCRVDILPDILLYLEEAICSCGKWGFVGTAGSTIA